MNWFYYLSVIISVIFAIAFLVIFFCAYKIYGNIEQALMKSQKGELDDWRLSDIDFDFNLVIDSIFVSYALGRGAFLVKTQ